MTGRSQPLVTTVLGAGQIGLPLARFLAARGHVVSVLRRGPPGPAIPGVSWLQGDLLDPPTAANACAGADVVFNTVNPAQYHRWDRLLPPLFRAAWAAARDAGARLVQLDNLYMVGRPRKTPFDEQTPPRPCAPMGRLRAELAEELMELHRRGDLQVACGRACDFFGPGAANTAVFRPDLLAAVRRGGTVRVFGDPDTPHGYAFTHDVAQALAILGEHEEAFGRIWHLPVAWKGTTRALIDRFAARAGTRVRVRRVPSAALRVFGLVAPVLRAVAEMSYQWDVAFVPDDSAIRGAFDPPTTPLDEAIDRTLTDS